MVEIANALAPVGVRARAAAVDHPRDEGRGRRSGRAARGRAGGVPAGARRELRGGPRPRGADHLGTRAVGEIRRIADEHRCESLLFGIPRRSRARSNRELEELINGVDCDRRDDAAPDDWRIGGPSACSCRSPARATTRAAGPGARDAVARLPRDLVFLSVLPTKATEDELGVGAQGRDPAIRHEHRGRRRSRSCAATIRRPRSSPRRGACDRRGPRHATGAVTAARCSARSTERSPRRRRAR